MNKKAVQAIKLHQDELTAAGSSNPGQPDLYLPSLTLFMNCVILTECLYSLILILIPMPSLIGVT